MPLRVFSRGPPADRHERDQLEVLLPLLDRTFKEDEDGCAILINIELPIPHRNQIDAVLIRKNCFVLIDLKDFRGRILANCDPNSAWVVESDGKAAWSDRNGNPFSQAERHRRQLVNYLLTRGLDQDILKALPKEQDGRPVTPGQTVSTNVRSWVVVQPGSKVTRVNLDPGSSPWFRITQLDELPREVSMEGSPRCLLSPVALLRMAADLGAQERSNWKDWYLAPMTESPALIVDRLRFTAITDSLNHHDPREVLQGIRDVARLGLKAYLPELVNLTNSSHSVIALEAVLVLEGWGSSLPAAREIEWLSSEDPRLKSWAWNHVEATRNPAAEPILRRLYSTGPDEVRGPALSLLLSLELPGTPTFLLKLAESWYGTDQSPNDATWFHLVGGLGCKGFNQAAPLLIRLIDESVESLACGWDNRKAAIIEESIQSLSKISDPDLVGNLTRLLGIEEGEFDEILLRGIGQMGRQVLVNEVLPYLASVNNRIVDAAISALHRLGGPDAFDALWPRFLTEVRKGTRTIELTEVLSQIDRSQFEARILKVLSAGEESLESSGSLMWSLMRFASPRVVPVVLPYLSTAETYVDACNVLSMPEVFPLIEARAKAMHDSLSDVERAAHVYLTVRTGSSMEIQDLEPHENDAASLVRLNVVHIYSTWRSEYTRERLETMVEDRDPQVRRAVAIGLLGHAPHWMNSCHVVVDGRVIRHAEAISCRAGIVVVQQRGDEVEDPSPAFVRKETITSVRSIIIPGVGPAVGITYKTRAEDRRMIIVPRDVTPRYNAEAINDWLTELVAIGYSPVVKMETIDPAPAEFVVTAAPLIPPATDQGVTLV